MSLLPADEPHRHGFFEPLRYPFRQSDWRLKASWLPLLGLIPVVNVLIFRGWRLEFVRRMARGESSPLPSPRPVQFLKNGLLLWCMKGVCRFYTAIGIPAILVAMLGIGGLRDALGDIRQVYDLVMVQRDFAAVGNFLVGEFYENLGVVFVQTLWITLTWPLYRVAMIRYAATGSLSSFFNLPANTLFMLRHARDFVGIYAFAFVSALLTSLLGGLLSLTVIGALAVPVVIMPIFYSSTAVEYGFLAQRFVKEDSSHYDTEALS